MYNFLCLISLLQFPVNNFLCTISCVRFLIYNFLCIISCVQFLVYNFLCIISYVQFLVYNFLWQKSLHLQSAIHAKRTYRELRMLKHMRHENVRILNHSHLTLTVMSRNIGGLRSPCDTMLMVDSSLWCKADVTSYDEAGSLQMLCKIYFHRQHSFHRHQCLSSA